MAKEKRSAEKARKHAALEQQVRDARCAYKRRAAAPLRAWWAFAECCERGLESSDSVICGADGREHEWLVSYWIGGEPDECGEHTYCRKCHEEYVP